ncbi:MAG: sugar transferase [Anaerolineales bacterium]|nr:sugar transferase [Anaerolineales bacterium]
MSDTSFPSRTAAFAASSSPTPHWPGDLAKRLLDILLSVLGLVVLFPLFLYIAWRIKHDSPGPIYFRGPRVGRGGKIFQILKFRTMHERPESYQGPRLTAQGDARITPIGQWLRDTKLNELPQLWNILRGEMSLVGPRPEDPEIAKNWPDEVRQEVLSVRPGLTSPASVLYRDEEARLASDPSAHLMDTYLGEILPDKLRLDQLYVRHRSFAGDLDVIFSTLLVVLPGIKISALPEERLFLGPITQLLRRYVSWFIADVLVTFIAIGLTGLFYRTFGPLNIGWPVLILVTVCFALLYSIPGVLLGANRISWSRAAPSDALDLLPGAAVAAAVALLINYAWPVGFLGVQPTGALSPWGSPALLPTGMIVMASALAFAGYLAVRYRTRLVTGLATRWLAWRGFARAAQERVLIIGGGETGQFAAWMLNNNHKYANKLRVVGFVDDDLFKQGARIRGLNVLGQRRDIPELVLGQDIGILVFAIHNISAAERQQLLEICLSTTARVVLFPDIPAALGGIARPENHVKPVPPRKGKGALPAAERIDPQLQGLPCDLCLTRVSPLKVDGWLAELEELALAGDAEGALKQIRVLRENIRGDASQQLAANLVNEEK